MYNGLFQGIFDREFVEVIAPGSFLACLLCALFAGVILTFCYRYGTRYTKSFVITLLLLPAMVCVVIMMVNGNVGTGVAVAGAFSLVRFRSVPGSAKEIGAIFMAMATGLVAGMGYLAYAIIIAVFFGGISLLLGKRNFGADQRGEVEKTLHITIPEDLDYTGVFEDLFEKYTKKKELTQVKTTNMGSLYKLTYQLTLKNPNTEKELMDELRCRNGNLEISVSRQEMGNPEL